MTPINIFQFLNSPEFELLVLLYFKEQRKNIVNNILSIDTESNKIQYSKHDLNRLLLQELDYFMNTLNLHVKNHLMQLDEEQQEDFEMKLNTIFERYYK